MSLEQIFANYQMGIIGMVIFDPMSDQVQVDQIVIRYGVFVHVEHCTELTGTSRSSSRQEYSMFSLDRLPYAR